MSSSGLKISCFCKLCTTNFTVFNTGASKSSDTIKGVTKEIIDNIISLHKAVSPNCNGNLDDIVALSAERADN